MEDRVVHNPVSFRRGDIRNLEFQGRPALLALNPKMGFPSQPNGLPRSELLRFLQKRSIVHIIVLCMSQKKNLNASDIWVEIACFARITEPQ